MNEPELYNEANISSLKDGILHLEELKSTICWEKGEKILDVGCGPGSFTADILLKFVPEDATVVGCDISRRMIDYANKRFKSPRLSFIEMDVESNNIWDICSRESFTKIHSLYCVHWIENTRAAFQNMYSLLKPGGEIYLVVVADHKFLNLLIDIRKMEPWKNFIKGKNYFTMVTTGTIEERKKKIIDELLQVGFDDVQVKIKPRTTSYESLDMCIKHVKSLDPWQIYIPEHMEKVYNACLVDMTVNKAIYRNPDDGKVTLNSTLFQIRSKKKFITQ